MVHHIHLATEQRPREYKLLTSSLFSLACSVARSHLPPLPPLRFAVPHGFLCFIFLMPHFLLFFHVVVPVNNSSSYPASIIASLAVPPLSRPGRQLAPPGGAISGVVPSSQGTTSGGMGDQCTFTMLDRSRPVGLPAQVRV